MSELLFLLSAHIGPILLLLSATGPLVQRWCFATFPDKSPFSLGLPRDCGLVESGAPKGIQSMPRTKPNYSEQFKREVLALAVACIVRHGELYRTRPDARNLTDFYLTLAGGSALGTLWVAVISPTIFTQNIDLSLFWTILIGLLIWRTFREKDSASGMVIWIGQLGAFVLTPLLRPIAKSSRWENLSDIIRQEPMISAILVTGLVYLIFNHFWVKLKRWRSPVAALIVILPLVTIGHYFLSAANTPSGAVEIRSGGNQERWKSGEDFTARSR